MQLISHQNSTSPDMYVETVCVLFILYLILYINKYLKWRKEILLPLKKLPCIRRYPLIGTVYILAGLDKNDLFKAYTKHVKEMPPLYSSWNGSTPEVNIKKPEHFEIIMNNSIHITKAEMYRYMTPWLGDGLLLSTGTKWHQRRKLITPTFHFKILENFMQVFVEKTKCFINILDAKADGEIFDVCPFITNCTLDILCETAMGVVVNAMTDSDSKYVKSVYRICELVGYRLPRPYLASDLLFYNLPVGREFKRLQYYLHEYSRNVISDRKELLSKQQNQIDDSTDIGIKKRRSFLDLLLEASANDKSFTIDDIREEVDTFMFEGHDTTTASLCWLLFSLGNNLDVQDKAFLEIEDILGDKSVPTSLAELNQMHYLECVIKEALRLYPSVPLIGRTTTEEFYIDGYKIPRGITAALHIHHVHRDPDHFPNPERFDPDRFLPENCAKRHAYAYIPFSAGPRNCIGQKYAMYEEKTVLSAIIKKYEIRSIDKPEDVKIATDLILRPADGIKLVLKRRKL